MVNSLTAAAFFVMSIFLHKVGSTRVSSSRSRSLRSLVRSIFSDSPAKHVVLNRADLKPHVCIIGDVHGCLEELKDLLDKVFVANDKDQTTVIFAGDLVNKGPFSAEVVQYVRTMENTHCVRGNHDDYVVKRGQSKGGFKAQPWEAKLTPEDHEYLKNLPYSITLPSLNAMVVHAGIVPNKALQEQKEFDMMMMRNVVAVEDQDQGELKALIHESEGEAWAAAWDKQCKDKVARGEPFPPHIYFGHDAKRLLQSYDYATGLDTGCCYGKKLTAIVLSEGVDRSFVEVAAREVYEVPRGTAPQ